MKIFNIIKSKTVKVLSSLILITITLLLCTYLYEPHYDIEIRNITSSERISLERILNQDMPFLFHLYLQVNNKEHEYQEFLLFLIRNHVHNIVKPWELICQPHRIVLYRELPYSMPPRNLWTNIVPTLSFIKQNVIPVIGEVEVISAYRDNEYNTLSGGVRGSRHLYFSAVDIIPVRHFTFEELEPILLSIWRSAGAHNYMVGIGIYSGIKFHIDTMYRYRKWNSYQPALYSNSK